MRKTIRDFDFYDKRVLVRADFNVPLKDGVITSDVRIVEELPTLKYLLEKKAKVIVCSHLGRPDGKVDKKYSLKPVFERLEELLPNTKIYFCPEVVGAKATAMADKLNGGELLLLENVRFERGEEENDPYLIEAFSKLADIYVFDAFGTSHRKHASTYGIAKILPSTVGFLVEKELKTFEDVLKNPNRPFVAILGGAKIGDKIDVVKNLLNKVDTILIGGGMCFTFIKAIKGNVGASLVDDEKIKICYEIIKEAINKKVKIILPVDFICAKNIDDEAGAEVYKLGKIPSDKMGLDMYLYGVSQSLF